MKQKMTFLTLGAKSGALAASGPGGRCAAGRAAPLRQPGVGLVGHQRRQGEPAEAGGGLPQHLAARQERAGSGVVAWVEGHRWNPLCRQRVRASRANTPARQRTGPACCIAGYGMKMNSFRLNRLCATSCHTRGVVEQQRPVDAPLLRHRGQVVDDAGALDLRRRARERLGEHVRDAPVHRRRLALGEPPAPLGRLSDDERAVEQRERLGRHVRGVPLAAGRRRLRQVEDLQERVVRVAPDLLVDAPPPVAVHRAVVRIALGEAAPRRVVHRHRRPVHRRVEAAGDRQHRVADRLGVETPQVGMLQQPIGRVDLGGPGRCLAAHPVGPAEDEAADEALHRVAVVDEAGRQMVE